MQMFWNGQKIVDLSRAFLDTSGCAKKQDAKITHLQEISSNSIKFNEDNFYKILAEKNTASQKGLVEMFDATRVRISKTEFISCPGCGRTLYNLQTTIAKVKKATSHLKGLKIGIMGCIVNGPGEMADADYGYVGAGVGRISLYKGKVCVQKNIPENEAVERLVELIKENGDWKN
jgi:4-hydroxy-3-methylbut-2-en-1-yl diphosphate synthase IspG/GcpE